MAAARLPALRPALNAYDSPHLVLLGAGASRAACPNGDATGKRLPLMDEIVAVAGLGPELEQAGIRYEGRSFELLYQELLSEPRHAQLAETVESRIRAYFQALRLPSWATLYDRLLLSLRPKDLVATFNWDPLLVQAFLRNRHLVELPRIVFLHGNVAVGICLDHRRKGFLGETCDLCRLNFTPTELLYPIEKKNYNLDPFISSEWKELQMYLEDAYLFTIIGYAAPASDVEAKSIMLKAWESNQTRELAEIDIIDIKTRRELETKWSPFFLRNHYGVARRPRWLFTHARRSCDHFAMATLQQKPCREMPLPRTRDLRKLQLWAAERIKEEAALRDEGRPLPC